MCLPYLTLLNSAIAFYTLALLLWSRVGSALAFGSGEDKVPDVGVVHLRVYPRVACRSAFVVAPTHDTNLCTAARVEQRPTAVTHAGIFLTTIACSDHERWDIAWRFNHRVVRSLCATVRDDRNLGLAQAVSRVGTVETRKSPTGNRQLASWRLQIVLFCGCELDRLDALYRTLEL